MQPVPEVAPHGEIFGRYVMYGEIAVGGMATVYFGRLRGERGFSRTVAIKRLHRQFAADPDFVTMLTDEARLAVRVKHPNVVAPFDVVAIDERELLLVMEYIHGESLAWLLRNSSRTGDHVPLPVTMSIVTGALHGLHAAHEAVSDRGVPLHIVHRDVSPPNILVGVDGVSRVLDFGVAKASLRANITREGTTKGKLSYMAPEQLRAGPVDRRTDIFAMGVVLWEMLALRKLFQGDDVGQISSRILNAPIVPASKFNPEVTAELDAVVARALARVPDQRFATARELALALEKVCPPASASRVGEWVTQVGGPRIEQRAEQLARVERAPLPEYVAPVPPAVSGRRAVRTVSMPAISLEAHRVPTPAADDTPPPVPAPPFWPRLSGRSWRWWTGIAAGVVVLLVAVVMVALAARGSSLPPVATPASSVVGQTPMAPAAAVTIAKAPPTPPVVVPQTPPAVAEPAPAPAAAETAAADEPAAQRPARSAERRRAPRTREVATSATAATAPASPGPAAPAAARDTGCDPPYVVDAKGIRRVRPECLASRSTP